MIGKWALFFAALFGGSLVVGAGAFAPLVKAATPICRVRNVSQDTNGRSFDRMVADARGGDRLRVKGVCPAHATIRVDLVIVGVGARRPVLTGRDRHGVVLVTRNADVILRNLVIAHGHEHPERFGGGIRNEGTLLVLDSVIRRNEDLGRGAISNSGWMTLRSSVVRGNEAASGDGAGVYNSGTMTILDSLIERNSAFWDGYDVHPSGGGVSNTGHLTVRRSIIRRNTAMVHGGGIDNRGRLILSRSRVAENTASAGGGVANNWGGKVTLRRGRVVANVANGDGGGIWNGFWSPWDVEQPEAATSSVALIESVVTRNRAASGGGIWSDDAPGGGDTSVTLDGGSWVAENEPDECTGTAAC